MDETYLIYHINVRYSYHINIQPYYPRKIETNVRQIPYEELEAYECVEYGMETEKGS